MIWQQSFTVATPGRGSLEITQQLQALIQESGLQTAIAQLFVHHTSASLLICENADPQVLRDLEAFMQRLVPDGDSLFRHTAEGPDDMPAHVRTVLAGCDMSFPVCSGRADLGTWQGIYLWEHRSAAHRRRLTLTLYGE
ncbi:MAG: secondary thiamine-phosphate synthase enzyme YjbQ [Nevskiales bacterium]